MDFRLQFQTWSDRAPIPRDEFLQEVRDALAERGSWETYAEYRMGAGPTVKVTTITTHGQVAYEAAAVWMSWSLSARAVYVTLEDALVAMPLLGDALFDMLQAGGIKGMLDQQGQPFPD